jgi:hypothetical protein
MAMCFACNKDIGYFAMVCGACHHLKRNFIRKNLVVFDCPHCGTICQETAWSYYLQLLIFVAFMLLLLRMKWVDLRTFSEGRYIATMLAGYFVTSAIWWKYIAQLKEPHVFWRE